MIDWCCPLAVMRVRSQGYVTCSFQVVTKDLQRLGYDNGRRAPAGAAGGPAISINTQRPD